MITSRKSIIPNFKSIHIHVIMQYQYTRMWMNRWFFSTINHRLFSIPYWTGAIYFGPVLCSEHCVLRSTTHWQVVCWKRGNSSIFFTATITGVTALCGPRPSQESCPFLRFNTLFGLYHSFSLYPWWFFFLRYQVHFLFVWVKTKSLWSSFSHFLVWLEFHHTVKYKSIINNSLINHMANTSPDYSILLTMQQQCLLPYLLHIGHSLSLNAFIT